MCCVSLKPLLANALLAVSPPHPGMPDEQREGLQEELIDIILLVLERNPQLHYYQGYHDIVVTFLLVVGEKLTTSLVEKLSTHHLRYSAAGQDEGYHASGSWGGLVSSCSSQMSVVDAKSTHQLWSEAWI